MKSKKTLLFLLICFIVSQGSVFAQLSLDVKYKSGKIDKYALQDIAKITYPEGKLVITNKNGANTEYLFTDIQGMSFKNSTGVKNVNLNIKKFELSPNPATDFIVLRYSLLKNNGLSIMIADIQGKIVWKQTTNKTTGSYEDKIDVKKLSDGAYMCILISGQDTQMIKFIKK